ncbi:MAG: hypothetical protein KBT02_06290 [Treponema sp.]|nr:hypothetical protein [Candidatus Treponema caballi]
MKRLFLRLLVLSLVTLLPANPSFTAAEQKALDDLFEYRTYITTLSSKDAIAGLDSYRSQNFSASKTAGFSEEAKLVLDAFVDLEKLVYIQTDNSEDPSIKQIADTHYEKLQAWIDAHPSETPNKWTWCAAAEAFNWSLAYLPMTQILTKGLLPKQYYQNAIDMDPELTYALCGLGQWLYFAPAVGGGGGNKNSRATLEKAVKAAKTDADKFIAHLYYSQILYQMNDKSGASKELDAADAIQPGSKRLARFRQVNAKGMSWFEFSRDFEKNRKKLGEPLVN